VAAVGALGHPRTHRFGDAVRPNPAGSVDSDVEPADRMSIDTADWLCVGAARRAGVLATGVGSMINTSTGSRTSMSRISSPPCRYLAPVMRSTPLAEPGGKRMPGNRVSRRDRSLRHLQLPDATRCPRHEATVNAHGNSQVSNSQPNKAVEARDTVDRYLTPIPGNGTQRCGATAQHSVEPKARMTGCVSIRRQSNARSRSLEGPFRTRGSERWARNHCFAPGGPRRIAPEDRVRRWWNSRSASRGGR
jgi:hypothetical protein